MKLTASDEVKLCEREAMLKANYEYELWNPDSWVEVAIKAFVGCMRLIAKSLFITAIWTVLAVFFAFMTLDLSVVPLSELRTALHSFVTASAAAATILVLGMNLYSGKIRNEFKHRAIETVDSELKRREAIQSQVNITEKLLVQYGLISHDDLASRRADTSTEQSLSAFEGLVLANSSGGRASDS